MDIIVPILVGILIVSLFKLTWDVGQVLLEVVEHRRH
jgi:hypothetical protein